jgi:hypothetical protein
MCAGIQKILKRDDEDFAFQARWSAWSRRPAVLLDDSLARYLRNIKQRW